MSGPAMRAQSSPLELGSAVSVVCSPEVRIEWAGRREDEDGVSKDVVSEESSSGGECDGGDGCQPE